MTAPVREQLNKAPAQYDHRDQNQMRQKIEEWIGNTFKRNETVYPSRLVLKDTVTGQLYNITMASGVLTQTAVDM